MADSLSMQCSRLDNRWVFGNTTSLANALSCRDPLVRPGQFCLESDVVFLDLEGSFWDRERGSPVEDELLLAWEELQIVGSCAGCCTRLIASRRWSCCSVG